MKGGREEVGNEEEGRRKGKNIVREHRFKDVGRKVGRIRDSRVPILTKRT